MLNIGNIKGFKDMKTPFWYYDMSLLRDTVDEAVKMSEKYDIDIHYSIKANSQPRILEYMRDKGLGVDCVSGREVRYSKELGFAPEKIVFAGVGKTDEELEYALECGIGSFNAESLEELYALEELAGRKGVKANVSVRVNPDVDAFTHRFITTGLEIDKFGIPKRDMEKVISFLKSSKNINFKGLHFHIGSQITDVENVFANECISANGIVSYFEESGLEVKNIDLGGGLGIDYNNPDGHRIPDFELWFKTIRTYLKCRADQKVHVEPGRSLVAQCASLISKIIFIKQGENRNFMILDTGMNDLLRPALYEAYHKIENLTSDSTELRLYNVVGPICESTDVIATERTLPLSKRGDIVAIRSVGAYGEVMSMRYNMREPAYAVFSDELK